jgi:hypothetical protein
VGGCAGEGGRQAESRLSGTASPPASQSQQPLVPKAMLGPRCALLSARQVIHLKGTAAGMARASCSVVTTWRSP